MTEEINGFLVKRCNECCQTKRVEFFHRHSVIKDGYAGKCKECANEYKKSWIEKNREKHNAYQRAYHRAWRENNREKFNEYMREINRAWREKNREKYNEYHREYRKKQKQKSEKE